LNYLFCSFTGAVDDLRESASDLAMVVHVREAQILKRQVTKLFNRLVDAYVAGLYLLE